MSTKSQHIKSSRNSGKPVVSRRFIGKNERKLNDSQVAKLIASKVYNATITDEDFAVQVFVEALVLPKDVEAYGEESMCEYIKVFMKSQRNGS